MPSGKSVRRHDLKTFPPKKSNITFNNLSCYKGLGKMDFYLKCGIFEKKNLDSFILYCPSATVACKKIAHAIQKLDVTQTFGMRAFYYYVKKCILEDGNKLLESKFSRAINNMTYLKDLSFEADDGDYVSDEDVADEVGKELLGEPEYISYADPKDVLKKLINSISKKNVNEIYPTDATILKLGLDYKLEDENSNLKGLTVYDAIEKIGKYLIKIFNLVIPEHANGDTAELARLLQTLSSHVKVSQEWKTEKVGDRGEQVRKNSRRDNGGTDAIARDTSVQGDGNPDEELDNLCEV